MGTVVLFRGGMLGKLLRAESREGSKGGALRGGEEAIVEVWYGGRCRL